MYIPADTMTIGLAGTALLAALWPKLRRVYRTRYWRPTVATILESWLDDGGGNPRDRRVKLCARYRFAANGTTYVGERIAFASPIYRDYLRADCRLSQLKPGKRIEVWYNPAQPTDAVIERKTSAVHYVGAVVALLCVAEVLATVVVGLIAG
jgi:Protein of unknown function (DUF3592)